MNNTINNELATTATELHSATLDELEGLDMDAFAYEAQPEGVYWRITDDGCADWAVAKIAEERAELSRIQAPAEEQIDRIMAKVQAAEKRCENGTAYLTTKLAEYFGTVPHKKNKDDRKLQTAVGYAQNEARRRLNETGRREAGGVPETLWQYGYDKDHRGTEVGRVQEAA